MIQRVSDSARGQWESEKVREWVSGKVAGGGGQGRGGALHRPRREAASERVETRGLGRASAARRPYQMGGRGMDARALSAGSAGIPGLSRYGAGGKLHLSAI